MKSENIAIIGMQWGDEGKGKVVDYFSRGFDLVVRYQGGANAGHTVVAEGEKYVFHLLPSGVLSPTTANVIGNGVVIDLAQLCAEIDEVETRSAPLAGRLFISDRATVVMPYHKERDRASETGAVKIGTTLRGIGPSYADKIARQGIRVCDLLDEMGLKARIAAMCAFNNRLLAGVHGMDTILDPAAVLKELQPFIARIRPFIIDTLPFLHEAREAGKRIMFEGAQGSMLDIDFGTYPYVTSSSTTAGGITNGCGLPPSAIHKVVGVVKAYTTRVGEGPFPTELLDATGEHLRKKGGEYGATTGRPRRCGWLDLVVLRHAVRINGTGALALTKLDVLDDMEEIKVCTAYICDGKRTEAFPADAAVCGRCVPEYVSFPGWMTSTEGVTSYAALPPNAKKYLAAIKKMIGVGFALISTGQGREAVIIDEDA